MRMLADSKKKKKEPATPAAASAAAAAAANASSASKQEESRAVGDQDVSDMSEEFQQEKEREQLLVDERLQVERDEQSYLEEQIRDFEHWEESRAVGDQDNSVMLEEFQQEKEREQLLVDERMQVECDAQSYLEEPGRTD